MRRKRCAVVGAAVAVGVFVAPAVGQGKAASASLRWSQSRVGATITSYQFGAFAHSARVARSFRLGGSSSTKSGKLAITLVGSPAFSITDDRCTGKIVGKKLSCWVRVVYAPRTDGAGDQARLRAIDNHGAAEDLSLTGSCSASGPTGTKHLYWVSQGPGTVNAIPIGGGCVTTLASGLDSPNSIAVDGTHVYWTSVLGGTVNSVPIGGGTVTTLASDQVEPDQVAVDGTHVYWTAHDGTVNEVPIGGGSVTTLESGLPYPTSLAVDAAHLYWVDGNGVHEAPLGGGSVTTLTPSGWTAWSITVDATSVYWATFGGFGLVSKTPIGGGTFTNLAPPDTGIGVPRSLAVDATNAYVAGDEGIVDQVPISGGSVTTLASGQAHPWSVAVYGTHVYWVNAAWGEGGPPYGPGTLNEVPVGGGSITTLATDEGSPRAVAVGP